MHSKRFLRPYRSRKSIFRIAAVMLLSLLLSGCSGCSTATNADSGSTSADASADASEAVTTENQNSADFTVEWNGKTYRYDSNLTNILFMGIDKDDEISQESNPGGAGQADCLMLLSLNDESQEATILQINRNTMTQIDLYDSQGNYAKSIEGQICLQYAYNLGGSRSARSTRDTVSTLLYGLSIDGYFALDISGVPEINDALGCVTVTCSYDYTYIDDSYTEGAVVTLEGEAAQTFVQYRDITEFNSVQGRMYRQVDYVTALISNMNSTSGSDLYELLTPYLDTYIITDLTADELNAMRQYTYLTDEVLYLPGEEVMGEEYEEFYVDEDALQELIIETYYIEVTDS